MDEKNTKETISERLKQIRLRWGGISQREMARRLKMTAQNYNVFERGACSISAKTMTELDNQGVDLHWLLTGEGSMLREDVAKKIQEDQESLPEIPRVYEAIKDSRAAVIEENEIREEAEETVKRWRKPTKEEIEEAAEEMLERRSESAWRKQYVPRIDRRGCTCRRGKRIGRILRIAELIDTIMGGVDDY